MRSVTDLPYRAPASVPMGARCTADLHLPDAREADCLMWVHGGGLTEGDKGGPEVDRLLVPRGWAVASPNYRLLQHAPWPACIEDIAAAVAWVRPAMAAQGVTCRRLFIGGVSAGAYLVAMVALDRSWLAVHGLDPAILAGAIPLSGQMTSHFAYRAAIGHPAERPLIDRAAPLWHVRADAPPLLLIAAENDMPCRPEENRYLVAALNAVGNRGVSCHVIPGRDHGTVGAGMADTANPVVGLLLRFLAAPGPVTA